MGRRRTTVAPGSLIVRLLALVVVGAATAVPAPGCGPDGSAGRHFEPTLPTIDTRPKLVLVVTDETVRAEAGEREDPAVRTDPPSVPSGSVIEVFNGGTRDHRLRGGESFDTGIMRPGETTVVVLTNPGSTDQVLELVEVIEDRQWGELTVQPGPSAGE